MQKDIDKEWLPVTLETPDLIDKFADLMEHQGCKKNSFNITIDAAVIKHNLTIPNTELFIFENDVHRIGLGFREQETYIDLIYVANKFLKQDIDIEKEYEIGFNIGAKFVKKYLKEKNKTIEISFGGSGNPTEVHNTSFLTRSNWKNELGKGGVKINQVVVSKTKKTFNKIKIEEL